MTPTLRILTFAFALVSTAAFAGPQLQQPTGDHVIIERTRVVDGEETTTRTRLSWAAFEQKYGFDPYYEMPDRPNDRFERIIPTPRAPSNIGGEFNNGDTATFTRRVLHQNVRYTRVTTFTWSSRDGEFGITSNNVTTRGGGSTCGGVDQPPCKAQ